MFSGLVPGTATTSYHSREI